VKKRKTTEVWKEVAGVLVPARLPEEVGLGCPKCDDHALVRFSQMHDAEEQKRIEAFVKRHEACGPLDTLEIHQGRLEMTGQLKESQ
jgi:hypothetical protein